MRLPALTLLLAVLLAAPAAARDRDRDRMPDRWERAHGMTVGKRDGKRDRDRDGLVNRLEYRTAHDPLDPDSDDDGIADGREGAGTVAKVAPGRLILRSGRTRAPAALTEAAEISCRPRVLRARAAQFPIFEDPDDLPDDAEEPESDVEDDPAVDDGAEWLDDDEAEPEDTLEPLLGAVAGDSCPAGAVRRGAVVHESEVVDGVLVRLVLIAA